MYLPTEIDVADAADRIASWVHRTPTMTTSALGLPFAVEVKLENTQVTGTFKARGAFNVLQAETVPNSGVVAASGGNHGAAVAYAATTLGHRVTIFVPEMAGPSKITAIRHTGADLHVMPGDYSNALNAARAFEEKTGAMQIHAYDATLTVAGQGTLMREWELQALDADTILIAVGGGGLIGGALSWLRGRRKVVAVEPIKAATLHGALRSGPETVVDVGGVAANALGARQIGRICYDLATEFNVESVLVSDEAITDAQNRLWSGLRQWVEPAGATALAALISGAYTPGPKERVAILLCGANPAPGPFD